MILKLFKKWRQSRKDRRDAMIADLLMQRAEMKKELFEHENEIHIWLMCHDHLVEVQKLLADLGYKEPA